MATDGESFFDASTVPKGTIQVVYGFGDDKRRTAANVIQVTAELSVKVVKQNDGSLYGSWYNLIGGVSVKVSTKLRKAPRIVGAGVFGTIVRIFQQLVEDDFEKTGYYGQYVTAAAVLSQQFLEEEGVDVSPTVPFSMPLLEDGDDEFPSISMDIAQDVFRTVDGKTTMDESLFVARWLGRFGDE